VASNNINVLNGFTVGGDAQFNGSLTAVTVDSVNLLGHYKGLVISGSNGGTGTAFVQFSGPATSVKTFTLPNASATILTDNALITAAQGGTGNGFTQFTGPATSVKTYTLPNASATILTDNTNITVAQGGTGTNTFTTNGVLYGNAANAIQVTAQGAANSVLTANVGAPVFSSTPRIDRLGLGVAASSNYSMLASASYASTRTADTVSGGAVTVDLSQGNCVFISLPGSSTTTITLSNPVAGGRYLLEFYQAATSG
jgi:hypothetical protein